MAASAQTSDRRHATIHCVILGLSMFLLGLYLGQTLVPDTGIVVVLQTGLIGLLGFLGLSHQASASKTEPEVPPEEPRHSQPSSYVEWRLDRHISEPEAHSQYLAHLQSHSG